MQSPDKHLLAYFILEIGKLVRSHPGVTDIAQRPPTAASTVRPVHLIENGFDQGGSQGDDPEGGQGKGYRTAGIAMHEVTQENTRSSSQHGGRK